MRQRRPAVYAVACACSFLIAVAAACAQAPAGATTMTIVRHAGREDGEAQITVKGKVRKISPHAVAAFPVRGGQGALILGLTSDGSKAFTLRYYDLASGRRRLLAMASCKAAAVAESEATGEAWAFALSGKDAITGQPCILVGDDEAAPGLLLDAAEPALHAGLMTYQQAGSTHQAKLDVLLGTAKDGIYAPPGSSPTSPSLLQVFRDGKALAITPKGAQEAATWQTDGQTLELHFEHNAAGYRVPWTELTTVKGVPAGKRFVVRLLQPLSSHSTHEGDAVKGCFHHAGRGRRRGADPRRIDPGRACGAGQQHRLGFQA